MRTVQKPHRCAAALPSAPGNLISRVGRRQQEEKTRLAVVPSVSAAPSVATARAGSGMLTRFPFGQWLELPTPLGSTNPCPSAVHMEPFSSSALEDRVRVFATNTKICTEGRSTGARARASARPSRPATHPTCVGWPGIGEPLSAIHFQGQLVRPVSCYTLLGGCRLP